MKVTVLGTQGPYPGRGGACAGYLVQAGTTNLLIDCGPGVLGQLQEHLAVTELTAAVLTHLHYDHISDFFTLRYALMIAQHQGRYGGPLPVHAMAQPEEVYRLLSMAGTIALAPLYFPDQEALVVGDLSLRFAPTLHAFPCLAVRVEAEGGSFVFSADTGWSEPVRELARGADLLICEANLLEPEKTPGQPGHLSAGEAARLGREAGVGRLLLTHLFPEADPAEVLRRAQAEWPEAQLAEAGRAYRVGGGA